MKIIRKDATITPTGADEDFPGTFEVILSAPTLDRDGETLLASEWKQPLPDRITFDTDHAMSVASTVGSGVPSLNDAGELVVSGAFSSLPRAQEVRTLVREGHINTTSVAFMSSRAPQKDGKQAITRELLNGAFVSIPSNREALVLSSKAAEVKLGARNSATDLAHVQSIHDHAAAMGADCAPAGKSAGRKMAGADGMCSSCGSACCAACGACESCAACPTCCATTSVSVSAIDAAIDQAIDLFAAVDVTTLPAEVQQAIALIQAADATVDELLEALGIPDPDEATDPAAAVTAAAAAGKSVAAAAVTKAAEDAESIGMHGRSIEAFASAYLTE